jgi:hypothetical protein
MSVSRKTNRDHAKKTTRPMVEDEVVASQSRCVTHTSYHCPRKLLSSTRAKRQNSQLTVNGSGGINLTVARRGRSYGTDKNVSQGRVSVV